MQINAINSMNFKGYNPEIIDISQEDFEMAPYDVTVDMDKFEKAAELTGKLLDSDKKGILATGATVAGIGVTSFTKGASVTAGIDRLSGDKVSELFESSLKKGSKFIQEAASNLQASEGKKLSTLANFTGKALKKGEEIARAAYKNLSTATKKVAGEVMDGDNVKQVVKKIKTHSAGKGLAMVTGIASAIALVPGLLKKDANNDGVADFKQKTQNVYAKNSKAIDQLGEKATLAVELAQLLT